MKQKTLWGLFTFKITTTMLQFSTFDLTGKGEMSQTLLTNKKEAHIIKPT
jgi:hypothetical protein